MPKPHNKTPIRVLVRETEGDCEIIHDRTGNHNDKYFREWIENTTFWAMRNGKSVLQYPVTE